MAITVQDFLNANPDYVGQANYVQPQQPQAPKKQSGKGGFLSSIISELGGAGGAAAGATAGAALGAPIGGIGAIPGGIIGGIIGGFGGGFGGRVAENKIRDNRLGIGAALKEGALSGVMGGIGPAFQGARGAYAAGKAAGYGGEGLFNTIKAGGGLLNEAIAAAGETGGKSASQQLAKTLIGSGAKTGKAVGQGITNTGDIAYAAQKGLQSAGKQLRGLNRGIVSGNAEITPQEAISQNRALDKVNKWFSGIGKSKQYENADDAMKALSNTYKVSGEGAQVFGKKANVVIDKFIQNLDNNPILRNLTSKESALVTELSNDISKIKTNADFVDYMAKRVNPLYKELRNGNPGSVKTQIYEAFRQAGKATIDENMATRSGVNKQFANLLGATSNLGRSITRDTGTGIGQGPTLSRLIGNVSGAGMDILGRSAQQLGKVTKYTTPAITGAATRGLFNGGQPVDQTQTDMMQSDQQNVMGGQDMMGQQDMMGGQMNQIAQVPQQSAYSLQQALADYQRAPTLKAQQQVMDYYDFVSKAEAAQQKANTPKLTASQQKSVDQVNSVSDLANQIENSYIQAGGGGGVKGFGTQLATKVPGLASQAKAYESLRKANIAPLARAISGEVGVLTDRDIARAEGLLPKLSDTQYEAQLKMNQLRKLITARQAQYAPYQANQSQFSDIISQLQGGQ